MESKEKLHNNIPRLIISVLFPIVSVAVLFLLVKSELETGFLTFIDQGFLVSKKSDLTSLFNLWSENNLGLISSIIIPLTFSAKLLSWVLFRIFDNPQEVTLTFYFLTTVFIYLSALYAFTRIQNSIFNSKNIIFPAISASLYAFNFSAITNTGVLDSNFHIIALSPILLCLLIEQINGSKGIKFFFLEVLLISLIINNIPFALGYLLTLYVPYILFNPSGNFFKTALKYTLVLVMTLIISSYFLYSYFYAYKNIMSGLFYTVVSDGGFVFLNNGIAGLFSLIYDWTTQIFYNKKSPHPYFHYYLSRLNTFTAFSIWALVGFSITAYAKRLLRPKPLIYLLSCILLSFFLIKGDQNPFGWFNTKMYEINPLMGILRTPSSKFSLPIMMYLSVLVLFAMNIVKNNHIRWLMTGLIFIHISYFFNPIRFIGYHTHFSEKSVAYINDSYVRVSEIINSSAKQGAVYMYPSNSAGFFKLGDKTFYGQDMLGKIIKRPIIHTDNTIMKSARKTIDSIPPSFDPKLIGNLSIRYVILRNDFDSSRLLNSNNNIIKAEFMIRNSRGFKQIYKDATLTVYELSDIHYKDIVSATAGGINIPLQYNKISPSLYSIVIPDNIPDYNILLNFNNTYDREWKIRDNDMVGSVKKLPESEEFGNKWIIESGKGKTMEIYYSPQKYLSFFYLLSLTSFIIIILMNVLFCKKEEDLLQS